MFKLPSADIVRSIAASALRLARSEDGATSIEYAMVASGVAVAIAATVFGLGTKVNGLFTSVATGLK
jgi:pilus assembly protein Flp/PilA